jgi:hypothetical protein
MADQTETGFTESQLLQHLLASSIRMEAAINVLIDTQAALTAKVYGTEHEQEYKDMSEAIEKQKEAILAHSIDSREATASPQRATVRELRKPMRPRPSNNY